LSSLLLLKVDFTDKTKDKVVEHQIYEIDYKDNDYYISNIRKNYFNKETLEKIIELLKVKEKSKVKKDDSNTTFSLWNKNNGLPPIITKSLEMKDGRTFTLIDDGELFGGTKVRLLYNMIQNIKEKELVYAGPDSGMAQIAIGYVAKKFGKKATMFVNTPISKKNKPYLVDFGMNHLGIEYKFANSIKDRTLKETQQAAEKYSKGKHDVKLFSFGLKDEESIRLFTSILKEDLKDIKQPERCWLVVGSGMILNVLQNIWPSTTFMCVQVGKTVWPDQLRDGKDKLFIAKEKFWENAKVQPPYESIDWYDSKLWTFVEQFGEDGDYIWNVASLPTKEKLDKAF